MLPWFDLFLQGLVQGFGFWTAAAVVGAVAWDFVQRVRGPRGGQ